LWLSGDEKGFFTKMVLSKEAGAEGVGGGPGGGRLLKAMRAKCKHFVA